MFRVVADSIHFLIPLSLSSQTGLFLSILDWKCQIREFEEKPRDNWTRRYWSELQSSSSKTKHDKKMSNATSRDHVTRKNYLIDVFSSSSVKSVDVDEKVRYTGSEKVQVNGTKQQRGKSCN